jgi:serine/threonine protein kinase
MSFKADPFHLVGTTVADRYAVEEVVGEGGFSVVYRAMHLVWQRPVAIKAFKGGASLQPLERERMLDGFFREGALLAELSERTTAVCQARDTSTLETREGEWVPYMVLEWLDGETLEEVLAKERQCNFVPRSISDAIALLDSVVAALAHAHGKNIAHRDLKPANLFVLGDARGDDCILKILDFGIAKVLEDARKSRAGSGANETSMFTPRYGAPEQFSRVYGPTGPWTDVFALALVLVELISGKPPLRGETIAQLGLSATSKKRRPTPRTLGVVVSDRVERVFATALAIEPLDRYLSAADFWNALQLANGTQPNVPRGDGVTTISPPPLIPLEPMEARLSFPVPTRASVTEDEMPGTATELEEQPPPTLVPPIRLRHLRRIAETRRRLAIGVGFLAAGGVFGLVVPHTWSALARMLRESPSVKVAVAESAHPAPMPDLLTNSNVRARANDACPNGMVHVPHGVGVGAFCIDQQEVTTADYVACVERGSCRRAEPTNAWERITVREKKALNPLCNALAPAERGKRPMNCIERESARAYCAGRGARLPTMNEWRAGVHLPDAGEAHAQAESGEWVDDALAFARGDDETGTVPTRSHVVGFRCAR